MRFQQRAQASKDASRRSHVGQCQLRQATWQRLRKRWASSSSDTTYNWDSAGNGKSNKWSSVAEWGQGWTDDKGQCKGNAGQQRDYVPRLEGRYAFCKAVIRPYSDDQGSAKTQLALTRSLCRAKMYSRVRPGRRADTELASAQYSVSGNAQ